MALYPLGKYLMLILHALPTASNNKDHVQELRYADVSFHLNPGKKANSRNIAIKVNINIPRDTAHALFSNPTR